MNFFRNSLKFWNFQFLNHFKSVFMKLLVQWPHNFLSGMRNLSTKTYKNFVILNPFCDIKKRNAKKVLQKFIRIQKDEQIHWI